MLSCYSTKGAYEHVCISKIAVDLDVLKNFQLNHELLERYTHQVLQGVSPVLSIIFDGHQYWLADNLYWLKAAIKANMSQILCDIKSGTRQQAIQSLMQANAAYQQISTQLPSLPLRLNSQTPIHRRNSKLPSTKH